MNEEQAQLLITRVEQLGQDHLDIHAEMLQIKELLQEILKTIKN